MGEAKRRRGTGATSSETVSLKRAFAQIGVNCDEIGFYDHPNFLIAERSNPSVLAMYARWVQLRPRDPKYDAYVRETLPKLVEIVAAKIELENWLGACVTVSMMFGRMLDRLGIWNFILKGGLSAELKSRPEIPSRHLWYIDSVDHPGGFAGHAWIVAPPFSIVDVTLRFQHWPTEFNGFVPRTILTERADKVEARAEDLICEEARVDDAIRHGRPDKSLHYRMIPEMRVFERMFPAKKLLLDKLEVRYVPVGVGASDHPLEEMGRDAKLGIRAIDFWNAQVAPYLLPYKANDVLPDFHPVEARVLG